MTALQIMVVSDGPAESPTTNSGVARGVTRAIMRSGAAQVVASISSRPTGFLRSLLLLLSIRPTRRWWWYTYNFGRISTMARSLKRERVARKLREQGKLDLVLHIRNIYTPSRIPYVAFIDSTSAMANRGWSAWGAPTERARRSQFRNEKRYYQNAICVVTAGAQAADSVVEDYGIDYRRVAAIGGGVNFDPLPSVDLSVRGRFTILWVGVDYRRKGGDMLVAAFAQVRDRYPDARLLMVGVDQQADVPGVDWLGEVRDRDALARLYAQASVFCLPARHEPYGLVIQEAMAFGLPCVVTGTGALPAIVEHERTGIVVRQPGELSAALIRLLGDPDLALNLGMRGREKAESQLTWDAVVERLLDTVQSTKGISS